MTKFNVTAAEYDKVMRLVQDTEAFNLGDSAYLHGLEKVFGALTVEQMRAAGQLRIVVQFGAPGIPFVGNGKRIKRFEYGPQTSPGNDREMRKA